MSTTEPLQEREGYPRTHYRVLWDYHGCVSANQTALYTQVTTDHISTASGLFRTFGYLGSIASSALITVFFTPVVSDQGLHGIAVIMVIFSIAGLAIVLADKKIMSRQD